MSRTVKDLIKKSMLDIGAIEAGENPSADEINDCLVALNDMLVEWYSDGAGAYTYVQSSVNLQAGKSLYTIGAGADIDTVRPEEIFMVSIRDRSGRDKPLDYITFGQYQNKANKSTQGTPAKYTFLPTVPGASLYLYPTPNITDTLNVLVYGGVEDIGGLDVDLETLFPRAYIVALRWGLAVEICPMFGREPSATVLSKAASSKRSVEKINFRNKIEPVDINESLPVQSSNFNIYTG
jgi:hypothetical protein